MRSSNWLLVIDMSKDGSRKANGTKKNIGQHDESQLSLDTGGENEAFGSMEESELGEGGIGSVTVMQCAVIILMIRT